MACRKKLVRTDTGVMTWLFIDEPKKCCICGRAFSFEDTCYFCEKKARFYCLCCGEEMTRKSTGWGSMVPVILKNPGVETAVRTEEAADW